MIGSTGKIVLLNSSGNIINYYFNLNYQAYIDSYADTDMNSKTDTGEIAKVEQHPRMEGRQMLMVIAPKQQ